MSSVTSKLCSFLYILAGLYNFSILIFCNFFRKDLSMYDEIFNRNGIISILLWGLAYMSICRVYHKVILLNLVFFFEKIFYFINWVVFMSENYRHLGSLYNQDKLLGIFFLSYGIGDILFGLFFFYISFSSFIQWRIDQVEKQTKQKTE